MQTCWSPSYRGQSIAISGGMFFSCDCVWRKVRRECGFSKGCRDTAGSQRQHEGRETGDSKVDSEEDSQHVDGRRLLQRHHRACRWFQRICRRRQKHDKYQLHGVFTARRICNGICRCGPVSVCHSPALYRNVWTDRDGFPRRIQLGVLMVIRVSLKYTASQKRK